MGPAACRLLQRLADGRFHSGEALAREMRVTRAAVWKQVRAVRAAGVEVQAVPGRGYRLAGRLELLRPDSIRAGLPGALAELPLHLLPVVDSTSRWLALHGEEPSACLAEMQTAGRGRRGRSWASPFGSNIYLSLLWRMDAGPPALGGLSLAVAVAAARALEALGVGGVGIKWPNDLYFEGRKLAGVLVEVSGESSGPSQVIVGVGMNVRMPSKARADVEQPLAELAELPGGGRVGRNELAAALIRELERARESFGEAGFAAFAADYDRLDVMRGRRVRVLEGARSFDGRAEGVDGSGQLLVRGLEGLKRFSGGEVSLRAVP